MVDFTFRERGCEARLEVASFEDGSYTFVAADPDGWSSLVILDRPEVQALVSVLSQLLDPSPTA